MRRGIRKFAGTSVIIGFVPVYALVAMALAQARPVQEAAVLIQVLCYAALGMAWIVPVMALISGWKNPIRDRDFPAIGQAASRPRPCGALAGRPMSRISGAPLSINRASASHTAPPRGSPGAASRTTSACAARVPAMPFRSKGGAIVTMKS